MTEPDYLRDTRTSWDTVAAAYAEHFRDDHLANPLDRALLDYFAALVTASGGGPVADVGCGPGRTTGYLRDHGLDIFGVDLAPGMIDVARRERPDLRFEVGSMLELDLPDGSLGGLLAWYSTIHFPLDQLPAVFAEFQRVLIPGAPALLAFQVRPEPTVYTEAFGHPVALTFQPRDHDDVIALLGEAGFAMRSVTVREREMLLGALEKTRHAYVMAERT